MDAQTLRRVLHDFFRFNPQDFYVQSSPTGFLIRLVSNEHPTIGQLQLFKIDNHTIGITAGGVAGLDYDGKQQLDVSGETEGNIYAQVDVGQDLTFSNLSIYDNGTNDPPPLSPEHVNQLLGSYSINDKGTLSVNPMVAGSQGLTVCFSDPVTANAIPDWKLV